ncbi:MAG: SMP-30/gluconolactonase/LRE family protein [Chthoniobacteraceae bacterium]
MKSKLAILKGLILAGGLSAISCAYGQAWQWTTWAGNSGGLGIADGTGTAAHVTYTNSVAEDATGNVYFTDIYCIRKMAPDQGVSTFEGVGGSGNVNGESAYLNPFAIATDLNGNIYATADDSRIYKISAAGKVTPFAGAVLSGTKDGAANEARFNSPEGLACDQRGNLYVADTYNQTIRKVTPQGQVSTLAGKAGKAGATDGPRAKARFSAPVAVAIDGTGNLYVADSGNFTIRKITPSGKVTTLAGQAGISDVMDGPGTSAAFSRPVGIAVDGDGNVYVADNDYGMSTYLLRKITPQGVVSTLAGMPETSGGQDGTGTQASFFGPYGICASRNGYLYVADGQLLRKVTYDGEVTTVVGSVTQTGHQDGDATTATFDHPHGMALDSEGNGYTIDGDSIRKIAADGTVSTLKDTENAVISIEDLRSIVRDQSGNIYAGSHTEGIIQITPAGMESVFSEIGATALAIDPHGNLYASEYGTIYELDAAGNGTPVVSANEDDFNYWDLNHFTVDQAGNIFFTTPDGFVFQATMTGQIGTIGGMYFDGDNPVLEDGLGNKALFTDPDGIALDATGRLYVADYSRIVVGTTVGVQPDIFVEAEGGDSMVGDNSYQTNNEFKAVTLSKSQGETLSLDIQNDGNSPDSLLVTGSAGNKAVKAKYFHEGQDVTQQVVAGAFSTGNLQPGEIFTLSLKLSEIAKGHKDIQISATSASEPTASDLMIISASAGK